jgi:hypothetical protein
MMQKQTIRLIFAMMCICGLLSAVSGQLSPTATLTITTTNTVTNTITQTITQTMSQTITQTMSHTITQTISQTITQTMSGTQSHTVTWTQSNTISNTVTNTITATVSNTLTNTLSVTVSGTVSTTGVPVTTPTLNVVTPFAGELNCFTVFFAVPNPDYPNYQFTVISPPTTVNYTYVTVVPTSQLPNIGGNYYWTACRTNVTGLQLFTRYSVQLAGYFSPTVRSPPSYPVFTTIGQPDTYTGPAISPDGANSVNGLVCNYGAPFINCTFAQGARAFTSAVLSFNCTRMVSPAATVLGAKAHFEIRLGSGALSAGTFLPTGCMCTGKLAATYSTLPTLVELFIVSPTTTVITNKPPIINTPVFDTIA